MNMQKIFSIVIALAFIVGISCNKNDEENTTGINPDSTDKVSVSFTKDIKPIIDARCIYCHSSTKPQLTNYEQIANHAEKILGAIKHESGFKPMPRVQLS